MGAIWLHDMPGVLSGMPDVRYWPGWETRSRSSGGFDRMNGIVIHHNACPPSQSTNAYCAQAWGTHPERPVGNFFLARDGEIIFGCAGASNCAGKGGPWITSRGTIPLDRGNQSTINIEAGNNGVGEPWSEHMQDRYLLLLHTLCEAYGFDPMTDIATHHEWAITDGRGTILGSAGRSSRKIDPAGPSRFGSINSSGTWNTDVLRPAVRDLGAPGPGPTPPPGGDDDMAKPVLIKGSGPTYYAWDGVTVNEVPGLNWVNAGFFFGLYQNSDPVVYADNELTDLLAAQLDS